MEQSVDAMSLKDIQLQMTNCLIYLFFSAALFIVILNEFSILTRLIKKLFFSYSVVG